MSRRDAATRDAGQHRWTSSRRAADRLAWLVAAYRMPSAVSYQTEGYRSYAGQYVLRGAFRNLHTVPYSINSYGNYCV